MVCCLEVHRPSEEDAESRFRPLLPPSHFPASTCHRWPSAGQSWGVQGARLALGADGRKGDISGAIVRLHYSS